MVIGTKMSESSSSSSSPCPRVLLLFLTIILLSSTLTLSGLRRYVPVDIDFSDSMDLPSAFGQTLRGEPTRTVYTAKATIAYAISITSCQDGKGLLDGAAVLQHAIYLNSIRASNKSQYDFAMFAFVHPNAANCTTPLEALGYQVQLRETPIRIQDVRGEYKQTAAKSGCCGEKEWLKLYTYLLTDYPVAVHVDLDVLILQPLDDLFDAMLFGAQFHAGMWKEHDTPQPINANAFFTRDYNMVIPGKRQNHQVGVQGGFLVVRPDPQVFAEYIDIILEGNFTVKKGWGLTYGGYYGAATIQGLAAYFYGHVRPGTALELNRCLYNNMADNPRAGPDEHNKCRTNQKECEDCRLTELSLVKSVHYTDCYKPWKCVAWSLGGWQPDNRDQCLLFHYEWFRVRYSLERFWRDSTHSTAMIMPERLNLTAVSGQARTLSYCTNHGPTSYIPITIPQSLLDAQTNKGDK
jgi:hypothetical protein